MHIHSLRRVAIATCAVLALAASPAAADSVTTKLRVEAGGTDIGPGWHYVHDLVSYETSTSEACGGSGSLQAIDHPTALGVLVQAAEFTRALRPVQISDQFDFGPFVCGIGGRESSDDSFWLYKVDHVAPEVGADQFEIDRDGREVLWYFVNSTAGVNTGNELVLRPADEIVEAGTPTTVVVEEYDANGDAQPASGVSILGAGEAIETGPDGSATLVFEEADRPVIRGIRGSDIPTDAQRLCVWEESRTECETFVSQWIVGTAERDRIEGGEESERIMGRQGRDVIDSRGDDAMDKVRCGRGRDVARVDELDRVARNCETVRRA
jgi:hypothetical protein